MNILEALSGPQGGLVGIGIFLGCAGFLGLLKAGVIKTKAESECLQSNASLEAQVKALTEKVEELNQQLQPLITMQKEAMKAMLSGKGLA